MSKSSYFVFFGFAILLVWGCRSGNDSATIAEVDGTVVTQSDLDRTAGKALSNAREQLYKLERQKLDEYIGATLVTREAQNRKVSVTTLWNRK
jgi:hypothetical protein